MTKAVKRPKTSVNLPATPAHPHPDGQRYPGDDRSVEERPRLEERLAGDDLVTAPSLLRLSYLVSYPLWLAVAIRALVDSRLVASAFPWRLAGLLLAFVLLLAAERWMTRRLPWYPAVYFTLQAGLIIGTFLELPIKDYFAVLFIPLSVQAMLVYPQHVAYRWIGAFTIVSSAILVYTQGVPESIPLILLYGVGYVFMAATATVTAQAVAARHQSQLLLGKLQEAHDQLGIYAEHAGEIAVVEERSRLSRDLHDSVTQMLYGVTLMSEAAARNLATGETQAAIAELRELQSASWQALREMRLFIFALRPSLLEPGGLVSALQARLAAVEKRAGLTAEFTANVDPLPIDVEAALNGIAQEVLNNVLKHAQASHLSVRLNQTTTAMSLLIIDDGIGFDAAAQEARSGLGLRGIEERVARIGGRLEVQSEPGAGTRVLVEVPR